MRQPDAPLHVEPLALLGVQEPQDESGPEPSKPTAEVFPRWQGKEPSPGVLNLPTERDAQLAALNPFDFDLANNTNGQLEIVGDGLESIQRGYMNVSQAVPSIGDISPVRLQATALLASALFPTCSKCANS